MKLAASLIAIFLCLPVQARDLGQWGQVDPKISACFKAAHDGYGSSCCDYADGTRVEDPNWGLNPDGSYWVNINGTREKVDPRQLVGQPCTEYAVAWTYYRSGARTLRCFMPGSMN